MYSSIARIGVCAFTMGRFGQVFRIRIDFASIETCYNFGVKKAACAEVGLVI
jgi:hypothetical protein